MMSALKSEVTLGAPTAAESESPVAERRDGRGRGLSTLAVIAWITAPRLLTAFVLSAATQRSAAVGTAGPDVRGATSGLLNWDGAHYLAIAEHGYRSVYDAPFFPLQPILAHGVGTVLGYPNATVAISWAAFPFAVWGIYDVAQRLTSRRAAIAAAVLFAWNPASVFLVTGYAQTLFIALTIWSLRFAMDRRWFPAALLAGAASAVVPQGVLSGLIVVVGILVAERGLRRPALAIVCGVLSEWGVIGYALYSRSHYGNAFEFEKAGATLWHDQLTYPFHAFVVDVQHSARAGADVAFSSGLILLVDAAACVVAVAVLVVALRQWTKDRRWALPALLYILGALLNLSVINAWGDGEARFISSLVTVYLVAAVVFDRLARRNSLLVGAVLVPTAVLAIIVEIQFHMVYWVT